MSSYTWLNDNFAAGSANSIILTTAVVACNVGDLVIVRVSGKLASALTVTLADNNGNTWTQDASQYDTGTSTRVSIWSSKITTQKPIGSTITATYSGLATLRFIDAIVIPAPATTPTLDSTAFSTIGASSGPALVTTPATLTPSTTDTVAVGINAFTAAGASVTPSTGWTEDADTSAGEGVEVQTKINTTTAAITPGGTASAPSALYNFVAAVYKLGPAAAAKKLRPVVVSQALVRAATR